MSDSEVRFSKDQFIFEEKDRNVNHCSWELLLFQDWVHLYFSAAGQLGLSLGWVTNFVYLYLCIHIFVFCVCAFIYLYLCVCVFGVLGFCSWAVWVEVEVGGQVLESHTLSKECCTLEEGMFHLTFDQVSFCELFLVV